MLYAHILKQYMINNNSVVRAVIGNHSNVNTLKTMYFIIFT